MSWGNCMRNLSGPGPATAHRHRSQALRTPTPPCALRAATPSAALHTGSKGGFALHEALYRCVAGVSHPLVVQFPPSRGLPDGRGTQNADHLVQNTPNSPIFTEVVCVLGTPVSGSGVVFARERRHRPSKAMSHVIPQHIFQTLKSDRWNCNVFEPSRKMTILNYVRNLSGELSRSTQPDQVTRRTPAPTLHP